MKKLLILLAVALVAFAIYQRHTLVRLYQGARQYYSSRAHLKYYQLPAGKNIDDVTDKLASDESIPLELRKSLLDGERRILVFKYLSDGNEVAGYLSFIPQGEHPLLVFLRGGNGNLGIMRPNNPFSLFKGYNVVGTLYRGNIYGGKDEFGGEDLHDVENLLRFLPELASFTHLRFQPPFAMMGVSRGAMQMFASLSHSTLVKNSVDKAISVSGNIDLNETMRWRPEMRYFFEDLHSEQNSQASLQDWIDYRNPVSQVPRLSPSLKVLMIYGLKDNRVSMKEQENMLEALRLQGITTQFVTFADAEHGMGDHMEQLYDVVLHFLK